MAELSPQQLVLKCPSSPSEKDLLMASISDLSSAVDDGNKESIQEPLNYLMSSLRSIVTIDDLPPDELFDEWQESFRAGDAGDDELDYNASTRHLFTSVNDLLHSKATFTVNECTSLETEMMRLKKMRRRKSLEHNCVKETNTDPLSLDDQLPAKINVSDDVDVRKQKERLANILKDAVGGTEERNLLPNNLRNPRGQRKTASKTKKSKKPMKSLKEQPLNPSRFEAVSTCDSAPKSPTKRRTSGPVKIAPISPLTPGSIDGSGGRDHGKLPLQRWDSECSSPVRRVDSAPRSPTKRARSPVGPRLSASPPLQLSSIPLLDLEDEEECDVTIISDNQTAMTPTDWEYDAAPKIPTRTTSTSHVLACK